MQDAYVESFNNKLGEFVKDLGGTFPDISDIIMLRTSFNLARNIDPSLPQKIFHEHVAKKFGEQILAADESFFMEYDYSELSQRHGVDIDIVGKIKAIWFDLSGDNKVAIWKYLQVLVLLSKKCA